jgi:hypothetical protein
MNDMSARKHSLRFKTEIFLLSITIALYIASALCYFYEPYREYAIPLTVIASLLLIIAAILYSKRR